MPRVPTPDASLVYDAVATWKDRCLVGGGSILSDEPLWRTATFDHLVRHLIEAPDEGQDSFLEKLEKQLADAPPEAPRLTAELLWLLYLPSLPSAQSGDVKRRQIRQIWAISGTALPEDVRGLGAVLDGGICHPGTGYNRHRPLELWFQIDLFAAWTRLSSGEQTRLLGDPWAMAAWVDSTSRAPGRQFRHLWLHMLFPDVFEPMATASHKRKIVQTYAEEVGVDAGEVDYRDRLELDRTILQIRERMVEQGEEETFNFYGPEHRPRWDPQPEPRSRPASSARSSRPRTSPTTRAWLIAPGRAARFWPEFQEQSEISIGWTSVGDLSRYSSKEAVYEALVDDPDTGDNPVMDTLACWEFGHVMEPGDLVLVKTGTATLLGKGEIVGDYEYREGREHPHVRKVVWDRATFGTWPLPEGSGVSLKTLTQVQDADWLEMALELIGAGGDGQSVDPIPPVDRGPPPYTIEDAMDGLFLDEGQFRQMVNALGTKKNLILQGPPGVGKTFIARRLSYALMGQKDPSRVEMVQFHQSYAYEDFVQGWRPAQGGGFELKDGVFHRFCRKAARDEKARPHVFIIDEINRGNLSRILGELMMLIEADKRGPQYAIPLTYSGEDERFFVPENLYVIGLMNTADRSLAMVDYALRRRFSFMAMSPEFESPAFRAALEEYGASAELIDHILDRIGALNRTISNDRANLGPGFQIGHSYFCSIGEGTAPDLEWYRQVVETEVVPLLREYWFDRPDQVAELRTGLMK